MEAEDTEGKYVVVEAQEASAGKYIESTIPWTKTMKTTII